MTFNDFWTNNNNPKLEKSEYLYNYRHILVLFLVLSLCIFFSIIFKKKSEKSKDILLKILASILLFFEITSRIVNLIIAEEYTVESVLKILLPMHICSVIVWTFIITIFFKIKNLYSFTVICGLLATGGFLLYPAVGLDRVYMTFTQLYSTISHSIGFVCGILMITLGYVKFNFKKIWQPFLSFAVMFLWGALLDFIIFPGENYMYLRVDPLELSLPFPYYFLYIAMLTAYISLYYIISLVINKIKNKRAWLLFLFFVIFSLLT